MASLASPKSFQASLSMPKEIMSPFQNLTKAIILSRKINSFAYFVEDNQSTDENDINLLLCVQSVVKLEEEFEDTPNHGSYNYIEAAIEITKLYIMDNGKHYCTKISTLVKKQLLAKLSQPDSFTAFDIDFYPLRNECIKLLESKYLLNFLDDQSRKVQSTWKTLVNSSNPSEVGKDFIDILETKLPNFCLQQHNNSDKMYEEDEDTLNNNGGDTYNTEQGAAVAIDATGGKGSNNSGSTLSNKISGISLHKNNRLSLVRKNNKKKNKKKKKYEYKFSWNYLTGNRESTSQIFTRLGRDYLMGIANSIEELNVEGFTEDVLRRFGSEELDQIIDTSFKAYNAFVESFLTVLHNNLYKHRSWTIATKESWRTFFHLKYYLYIFTNSVSMDNGVINNDDNNMVKSEVGDKIYKHIIDERNINELNFYDEIFRKSAMRISTSPQKPKLKSSSGNKDCITGNALVEFLLCNYREWFWNLLVIEFNAWDANGDPVPTRWESALFAQELLDRGYLVDVLNKEEGPKHFFDNSKSLYRFALIPSSLCFVPCFTTNGRSEFLIALARTMSLPRYDVLKNHRQGFRSIHNCFTAKDFIGFVMDYGIEKSVDNAVRLGKEFRKKEVINIIGGDGKHHHTDFEQSSRKLYNFNDRILYPCK